MDHDFRNRELRFSIFGLKDPRDGDTLVSAEIFSRTLRAFIASLKEADKVANRRPSHDFVISHLKIGSAEVGILERAKEIEEATPVSSVSIFGAYAESLHAGDFSALTDPGMVNCISALSSKAGSEFSHIDLSIDRVPIVRVDEFFDRQVKAAIRFEQDQRAPKVTALRFTGTAMDAFDGNLKEVDLRGQIWRGKLIPTNTKKEIDCIFRGVDLDDLRRYLSHRIWAEGIAIYSDHSALPVRFEINRIRPIKEHGADLAKWRGKIDAPPYENWGSFFDDE